jgi:hypothetical protein
MKNLITKETRDVVDNFCRHYDIENYTILADGSVDVDGDVSIDGYKNDNLPFKFNIIDGDFMISHSDVNDVSMFPKKVNYGFYCNVNKLTSCVGITQDVGDDFYICSNEELHSLMGVPKRINGTFSCDGMRISTLEGMPDYVSGDCDLSEVVMADMSGVPSTIVGELIMTGAIVETLYSPHSISVGGYVGGYFELDGHIEEVREIFRGDYQPGSDFDVNIPMIYLKYHTYYDVFVGGVFVEENFWNLIKDIKDGLE